MKRLRYLVDMQEGSVPEGTDAVVPLAPESSISFLLDGAWVYGHGFNHRQPFPLNRELLVSDPFTVNNIRTPVWVLSSGFVATAWTAGALAVRIDRGTLAIRNRSGEPVQVRVSGARDATEATRRFLAGLRLPGTPADSPFLGDSVFCTWTQHPRSLTAENLLEFASSIRHHDYPCRLLTIDDRWEADYGDLEFSTDFPDPATTIRSLHDLGFRVLLWVTPFVNASSRSFAGLERDGFLVGHRDGGAALFDWWGGRAGLVDLSRPEAAAWFRGRLSGLMSEYGIDGFKVDGGDAKYQPDRETAVWHRDPGPNGFAGLLLSLVSGLAGGLCESRTAWTPDVPVLWREGGKDSHFGLDNGLKALVALGLHLSLAGFGQLMPDMVGGRVQTMDPGDPLPTDELFVRWCAASAFFPSLQFSYLPWNYGSSVERACRLYARMHLRLAPFVAAWAASPDPVVRPLWYGNETMPELYEVGDAFLVGPDLLVAPVLDPATASRTVPLPPGTWVDLFTRRVHAGGTAVEMEAVCPRIPLLVRQGNEAVFAALSPLAQELGSIRIPTGTTGASHQAGIHRSIRTTG